LLFIDKISDSRHDSGIGLISGIYSLATAVPVLAVHVRRLHDIGKSGAWMLLHFVPGIGSIILFACYCIGSSSYDNRWGEKKLKFFYFFLVFQK
jgi:uncharacterized membrane protein YhaH (DUF805 family)